ncbi:hypothetical protein P7C70_g4626, partial [Phenoliferia sp. Uapishka_3]
MFSISPPTAETVDVRGATVFARYTYEIPLYDAFFRRPQLCGPYNACIATHQQAKYRYGFTAPKLAALLTTFANIWRPQLINFRAPAIKISSPASYASAVQSLKSRAPLPEEWVAYKTKVLRHRCHITYDVKKLDNQVGRTLSLECAMIRRLTNEVLTVEESWKDLSAAVVAYEEANTLSYFKRARSWLTGFVSKVAPEQAELQSFLRPEAFIVAYAAPSATCEKPVVAISETALHPASEPTTVAATDPVVVVTSPSFDTSLEPLLATPKPSTLLISKSSNAATTDEFFPNGAPKTTPCLSSRKSCFKWSAPSSPLRSLTISTDLDDSSSSSSDSSSSSSLYSSSSSSHGSFSFSSQSSFRSSSSFCTSASSISSNSTNTITSTDERDEEKLSAFDTSNSITSCSSSPSRSVPFKPFISNLPARNFSLPITQISPGSAIISPARPAFKLGSKTKKDTGRSWEERFLMPWIPLGNMSAAEMAAQNEYNIMHNGE